MPLSSSFIMFLLLKLQLIKTPLLKSLKKKNTHHIKYKPLGIYMKMKPHSINTYCCFLSFYSYTIISFLILSV